MPLPELDDPGDTAERLFEEACRAITGEHHKRDRAKAETREWTQTVCYDVLRLMISHQHAQLLGDRIARLGRSKKGPAPVNPFQRGLLAIYAHEKGLMDERDRSYFGKRLWYAYRHYVPTCFLKGFLHQVWSDGAEQRADVGFIEPEFAEWVIFERCNDEHPELRGRYPKELETNIRGLRNLIEPTREIEQRRARRRAERAELLDDDFDN
ncbi:MAG: hypothetical protein ABR588_04060 [Sphingomicrobium sp.]|nr:hypothetical protein [Sphingomonadales bacterium]